MASRRRAGSEHAAVPLTAADYLELILSWIDARGFRPRLTVQKSNLLKILADLHWKIQQSLNPPLEFKSIHALMDHTAGILGGWTHADLIESYRGYLAPEDPRA